uniref:Cytochrome b n=1 Tax=Hydra vulgaris TaxID=6087 RepID=A0A0H5APC2_HYDVU|nr:cytochrome b [Hydra vulgaris]
MRIRKNNHLIKHINSTLIDLPSPSNINYLWNFGSLLGLCFAIQLVTGIFLAMHYCGDIILAFKSIVHICRDVNYGFLLKSIHANGASLFFICVYIHIGKSLYYGGYQKKPIWFSGIIIFIVMMITAFIGYVLPWGQMSFWGATVITNFLSAIPYIGDDIVQWIWGGFSVNNATLGRFFSLHYLFPFVLASLILIHIVLLHSVGSSNPLGINSNFDKVPFHWYFAIKDIYGFFILIFILLFIVFFYTNTLGDPENFINANSLVTPVHIMPEWYFLFAYAILRSIPNKLGGVLALILSIVILFIIPFLHTNKFFSLTFRPIGKLLYWVFIANFILLTWLGSKPIENPYILISIISSLFYFFYFLFIIPIIGKLENYLFFQKISV